MRPNAFKHLSQHPTSNLPRHIATRQGARKLPQEVWHQRHVSVPRTLSTRSTIHLSCFARSRVSVHHAQKRYNRRSNLLPRKTRLRNRPRTSILAPKETHDPRQARHQARLPIEDLREIANGLEMMLDRNPGFQVLWKLKSKFPLDAQIATTLRPYLDSDEVRITPWLTTDLSALLQTGTIICSVHHGGGNSFYEATGTRTPQVVLPLWYDTYDFAARVEHLGIGTRGNKRSAPRVDGEEFGAALSTIVDDTAEKRLSISDRAKAVGKICGNAGEGRVRACEKVGRLARGWE